MKQYMKYTFLIFFFVLLVLSFLIIKPFLTAILSGCIAVYIFYPVYRMLNNKLKSKSASAAIMLLVILILLGSFSFLIGSKIFGEVKNISIEGPLLSFNGGCTDGTAVCRLSSFISRQIQDPSTNQAIISSISSMSQSIIISIPSLVLQLLIFIFVTYYLFIDGENILSHIGEIVPLKNDFKVHLKKQTNDIF